jgi:hypothetical protein
VKRNRDITCDGE